MIEKAEESLESFHLHTTVITANDTTIIIHITTSITLLDNAIHRYSHGRPVYCVF